MKFSLISDMHIDFPQAKTPYDKLEKNVIVAGDTSNGLEGLKFLNKLRNKGFNVFAIDGNHEHYRNRSQWRTPEQTIARFREDNLNVMEIEGIPVIGCNGWYSVGNANAWFNYMNDGPNIFTAAYPETARLDCNVLAAKDYDFLRDRLAVVKDKCIVVTHTAPCLETLNPDFEGHFSNEWYYNPLMYRLLDKYRDKILVWCHGHTHAASDKIVNGVRVVCNPRGYPNENPDWKPLSVEV